MYTHVVFDLDGTTLDTDYAWLSSLQMIAKDEFHKELTIEDLVCYRGMSYDKIYGGLGAPDLDSCMSVANKHVKLCRKFGKHNRIFDGMVEVLDALEERGIQMGVVTSRIASEMDDPLWKTIEHRFRVVIHAGMVKHLKPHAEPMELYLARAGADKADVLFVGDSTFDAGCARNAGVDFALATWGTHNLELDATYKPSHPMELLNLL